MTLKVTLGSMEHFTQIVSNKYDGVLHKIREQSRDVKDFRKRVAAMKRQDDEMTNVCRL